MEYVEIGLEVSQLADPVAMRRALLELASCVLPRISMGLTIAQLSERLRCAECGAQLHSVKPWRMEDVLGKPLGRRG